MIREATSEDVASLAPLIRSAYRDVADRFGLTSENAPTHPSNCKADWIEADLARGISYYLLSSDDTLCGCVALEFAADSIAYLERLAVAPEWRGCGLGTALLDYALSRAWRGGAREVSIGVIARHIELINWYGRRDFRFVETRAFDHLPFVVAYLRRHP